MLPLLTVITASTVRVKIPTGSGSATTYVASQILPAVAEALTNGSHQFKPSEIGLILSLSENGGSSTSIHNLGPVFVRLIIDRSDLPSASLGLERKTEGFAARLKHTISELGLFEMTSGRRPEVRVSVECPVESGWA